MAEGARPLLAAVGRSFVPNSVLIVATETALAGDIGRRVPFAKDKILRAGRPTAYVCERGACKQPTLDPDVLARQIAEARRYTFRDDRAPTR